MNSRATALRRHPPAAHTRTASGSRSPSHNTGAHTVTLSKAHECVCSGVKAPADTLSQAVAALGWFLLTPPTVAASSFLCCWEV